MPQPKAGTLTERQKKFCEEYISNGFNAARAYCVAFNKDKCKGGYAYTLLTYPWVKEYIEKRRTEIYDSLNIDAMRIAQELALMAFAEKEDSIYTPSVKLKALEQLSKNLGLQKQEIKTSNVIEVALEAELEEEEEEENQDDATENN